MNIVTESFQPMGPQFMSHGLPTIDTLDENYRIWIPATTIRRTPDIIHGRVSEHAVGQVIVIGDAVGGYRD